MNANLSSDSVIYVAGHRGLVGSAVVRNLQKRGFTQILTRSREQLDLTEAVGVREFFRTHKPDAVIVAAAKVGGIHANSTYRADFIYENLLIQNNLIGSAHAFDVSRLVFLGSSCIYPRDALQPMKEECLLTGSLEFTNRPYAVAKIAGLELIHALRMQYGRDYFSVMPTNLYGPGDNFHPENSHVLPALLRRFHEAVTNNDPVVKVWGSGRPRREFMFSQDCADAICHLLVNAPKVTARNADLGAPNWSHINIGVGTDVTIRELAEKIAAVTSFAGAIEFDPTKPDGTPRKLLDVDRLNELGWKNSVSLDEGLRETYEWYRENHSRTR